jgi:hypothetical protein
MRRAGGIVLNRGRVMMVIRGKPPGLISLLVGCALVMAATQARAQNNQPGPKGNVINLYGAPVGAVDAEGTVFNAYGSKLGRVDENGNIYNVSDILIGRVFLNGVFYNQSGDFLGYGEGGGSVYNVSNIKVGSVDAGGDLILIGGAARIIFFRGSNSRRLPIPGPRDRP